MMKEEVVLSLRKVLKLKFQFTKYTNYSGHEDWNSCCFPLLQDILCSNIFFIRKVFIQRVSARYFVFESLLYNKSFYSKAFVLYTSRTLKAGVSLRLVDEGHDLWKSRSLCFPWMDQENAGWIFLLTRVI